MNYPFNNTKTTNGYKQQQRNSFPTLATSLVFSGTASGFFFSWLNKLTVFSYLKVHHIVFIWKNTFLMKIIINDYLWRRNRGLNHRRCCGLRETSRKKVQCIIGVYWGLRKTSTNQNTASSDSSIFLIRSQEYALHIQLNSRKCHKPGMFKVVRKRVLGVCRNYFLFYIFST